MGYHSVQGVTQPDALCCWNWMDGVVLINIVNSAIQSVSIPDDCIDSTLPNAFFIVVVVVMGASWY